METISSDPKTEVASGGSVRGSLEDICEELESYLGTKARAEELEEKIEKTDALIDEIVYELYGLTGEEVEIVEEAVGEE